MLKDKKTHTVCRAGPHFGTVTRSTVSQVCGTREGESMTERGTPNTSAPTQQPPKAVLWPIHIFQVLQTNIWLHFTTLLEQKQSAGSSFHLLRIAWECGHTDPPEPSPPGSSPCGKTGALPCPSPRGLRSSAGHHHSQPAAGNKLTGDEFLLGR